MEKHDLMEYQRAPVATTAHVKPQCTARSQQSGQRCKRPPIPGSNVCRFHGGGAPQVKAKAQERLAALVDPAIARLKDLLASEQQQVALRAAIDVLDRNGLKPAEMLRIQPAPEEPVDDGVSVVLAEIFSPAELENFRDRLLAAETRKIAQLQIAANVSVTSTADESNEF